MTFVECTRERHGASILEILNDAIVNSTALYDYRPRTTEAMAAWFAAKDAGRYPVIGIENDTGVLQGFASYGTWRAWPAYKYTVEHSVYVHEDHRGQGIGRALLRRLIERATEQTYHVMVGCIDAANTPSITLHESLGFKPAGLVKEVGFKFGRWLDVVFYQLVLPTPAVPTDG